MWTDHDYFSEFMALRARVELHLNNGLLLLAHVLVFLCAVVYFIAAAGGRPAFIEPRISEHMALWTVLIAAHGAVVYMRSGLAPARRERLVEQEIRERLEQADTHLLANPRDGARVHQLLEANIWKRARVLLPLLMFAWGLAPLWVISGATYNLARAAVAWQATPMLTIVFGIGLLIAWVLRAQLDERQWRDFMRYIDYAATTDKPKRDEFDHDPAAAVLALGNATLGDDGELIVVEDDEWSKPKRQEN